MAVDATVLDVPDTPANARVFGYPGSRRGQKPDSRAFRLVMHSSCRNAFDRGRNNRVRIG